MLVFQTVTGGLQTWPGCAASVTLTNGCEQVGNNKGSPYAVITQQCSGLLMHYTLIHTLYLASQRWRLSLLANDDPAVYTVSINIYECVHLLLQFLRFWPTAEEVVNVLFRKNT